MGSLVSKKKKSAKGKGITDQDRAVLDLKNSRDRLKRYQKRVRVCRSCRSFNQEGSGDAVLPPVSIGSVMQSTVQCNRYCTAVPCGRQKNSGFCRNSGVQSRRDAVQAYVTDEFDFQRLWPLILGCPSSSGEAERSVMRCSDCVDMFVILALELILLGTSTHGWILPIAVLSRPNTRAWERPSGNLSVDHVTRFASLAALLYYCCCSA